MSNINFRPWIGKNYLSSGLEGKRILVLGESNFCTDYCGETDCESCGKRRRRGPVFAENIINGYVYNYSGYKYEQVYLCFERAMAGRVLTQEEREELWNSMAFYNYIQVVPSGHRQKWDTPESESAFLEVLKELTPDAIIVWGRRLYRTLPRWDGQYSTFDVDGNKIDTWTFDSNGETFTCSIVRTMIDVWTYSIDGKNIPALAIDHPSCPRDKDWKFRHKVIKTFLERI